VQTLYRQIRKANRVRVDGAGAPAGQPAGCRAWQENRLAEIERDWDRNRFADDPGKEGRFLRIQHLLYQFKQMREFHQELLEEESGPSAP